MITEEESKTAYIQTLTPHSRHSELDDMERSLAITEHKVAINTQKLLCGVLLVVGIGISWACSTQFSQIVQNHTKVVLPPFALMWLSTSFKIFCAIPILIMRCRKTREQTTENNPIEIITPQSMTAVSVPRQHIVSRTGWTRGHKPLSQIFFHAEDCEATVSSHSRSTSPVPKQVVSNAHQTNINKRAHAHAHASQPLQPPQQQQHVPERQSVAPTSLRMCAHYLWFYALWIAANYCYVRALHTNSATIVTVLFSSNNVFIYVLSIFVLNEIFSWFRMFGVIVAVLGIVFIALDNLDQDSSIVFIGSVLAIAASIFAAIYKVSYKRSFGDMHVANVCRFLSYIGLFNLCVMWVMVWFLDWIGWETLPRSPLKEWPWLYLIGGALCGLTFDFLINFGIAFTYPLFIALGVIVGIPFNLIADLVFHDLVIDLYEVLGMACIVLGFVVIVVSDLRSGGKGSSASFIKQ